VDTQTSKDTSYQVYMCIYAQYVKVSKTISPDVQ